MCVCTSRWVVGALYCDRNICWEDKLQARPVKDKKRGYLHFIHTSRMLQEAVSQAPPPPATAVWKCMKNSPGLAQTAAIHQHSDRGESPTLLSPDSERVNEDGQILGSDSSNHPRLQPRAHQSVGDTVSDH